MSIITVALGICTAVVILIAVMNAAVVAFVVFQLARLMLGARRTGREDAGQNVPERN
jgi:hypothetical protein